LISRFKSTLSLYAKTHPLRANARRFASDRGRMYTAIAATAAVAGVCAAGAVVGPAPTAETAARLATMAYTGPGTPLGPAEDSMFQTAFGPTGHGGPVGQNHGQAGQGQAGSGQSVPQAASQPYLIYDSVDPSAVPAGQPVATYVDGPFAVSSSQVTGHPSVLWIDTNGSAPSVASALDVEPGDATPAGAAQWVQEKLSASPKSTAVIYTMLSEWPQVQGYISSLPSQMQSHVRYWIADPTGVPHMVPGASATQWYWGNSYDISTAMPGF
jgi:hypothetical protein